MQQFDFTRLSHEAAMVVRDQRIPAGARARNLGDAHTAYF
jgi:hypothetical protein